MKIYKISIIVLNLILISSLSYADSNSTPQKNKLDELLTIIREAPNPLSKIEKKKIEEKVLTIYSTDKATLADINRRINYVERQNSQREAKIKNFEEELKVYKKRVEALED